MKGPIDIYYDVEGDFLEITFLNLLPLEINA